MSGQTKNQHYVPVFYLNRFASKQNKLSVYDVSANRILNNQNPRNYASKRYYYDVDKETLLELLSETFRLLPNAANSSELSDTQFIESALNRVESDIARLFRKIEKNPEILYDEDNQIKLLIFLHQMIYRVDSFREHNNYLDQQLVEFLQTMGLSEEEIIAVKAKHGMRETPKENQLYQIVDIGSTFRTAITLLENYDWYYGIVDNKNANLVTSDNPAFQFFLGFNDICFPISPKMALIFRVKDADAPIISRDKPDGHRIALSQRSVVVYNIVQESNAYRFLFGSSEEFKVLRGINKVSEMLKSIKKQ